MIKVIHEKNKKLVHFKCTGVISHKDYQDVVIPTLEKGIAKNGPLRILCDMREVKEIEGQVIWDDYKFGIHHLKDFDRMATVGDEWWLTPLMSISSLFYKIELKNFPSQEYDAAWKWVNE